MADVANVGPFNYSIDHPARQHQHSECCQVCLVLPRICMTIALYPQLDLHARSTNLACPTPAWRDHLLLPSQEALSQRHWMSSRSLPSGINGSVEITCTELDAGAYGGGCSQSGGLEMTKCVNFRNGSRKR